MRRFSVPFLFALAFAMVLVMPYGAVGASSLTQPGAQVPSSVVDPVATVASHAHYWSELRGNLLSAGVSASIVHLVGTASYRQWIAALQAWQDGASPLAVYRLLPQVAGIPTFSWGRILQIAAGGCVAGGGVGFVVGAAADGVGAGPGAGIGCAAGATAALLTNYLQNKWNNAESQAVLQTDFAASSAAWDNEIHLANDNAWSTANMTPEAEYYFYRLAAIAAIPQIENSSFNQTQDLIASTIPAQFGSVFGAYYGTLDNALAQLESAGSATGGGPFMYGTTTTTNLAPSLGALITSPTYVYLPSDEVGIIGQGGTTNPCVSTTYLNLTYYAYGAGTLSLPAAITGPQGSYYTTVNYYFCYGQIATRLGLYETQSPTQSAENVEYSLAASPFCLPSFSSCPAPTAVGLPSYGSTGTGSLAVGFGSGDTYSISVGTVAGTNGFEQLWQAVSHLQASAVAEGQAYWQELRNLGYTNPNQLPPNYNIPPPFGALPPGLCVLGEPIVLPNASVNGTSGIPGSCTTELNLTEMESLYYAYLDGMYLFFNSTTYLEHQPRPCDASGCAPWGNLNTYAVGDVYIPGAKNSTGTGSEEYGNVSTWNVTGDQLILMPQLNPLSIPVGKVFDVPANAPLEVYVVQRGEDLNLNGNGSNVPPVSSVSGLHALTTTPGDAIYIQFCQIQSTPQANCTLTMTTINDTATSLVCATAPPGSTSCPSPTGGAFSFGGLFGVILGAIGGAICSLTGGLICGSPAQTLAGVLVAIAVLVIVAVAAIAVIRYASGGSSRAVELRVSGKGGRK